MSGGRSHSRSNTEASLDLRLWAGVALNLLITAAETAGGLVSGSLALLADALHNLSDVAALLVAICARALGRRPPSLKFSYGFKRLEVMAALANAVVLIVLATGVGYEAVLRFFNSVPIKGSAMLVVAAIAFLANGTAVFLLHGHDKNDLNIRSAFLHLVQDAFASLLVVVAALLAQTRLGPYVDPAASILIGLAVTVSASRLVWQSLGILTEGTPAEIQLEELASRLQEAFAPDSFHHLHVWTIGPGQVALTAHVKMGKNGSLERVEQRLAAIRAFLAKEWKIHHATLEPEWEGCSEDETLSRWENHGRE